MRAHQGQVAAVPAHHLDDEAALVALPRCELIASMASMIRCSAESAPMVMVGAEHVVVDRPDQPGDHQRRMPVGGLPVDGAVRRRARRPATATPRAAGPRRTGCRRRRSRRAGRCRARRGCAPPCAGPRARRNSRRAGGADHGAAAVQDAADVVPARPAGCGRRPRRAPGSPRTRRRPRRRGCSAVRTTARTAEFMPCASPPLVSTARRIRRSSTVNRVLRPGARRRRWSG